MRNSSSFKTFVYNHENPFVGMSNKNCFYTNKYNYVFNIKLISKVINAIETFKESWPRIESVMKLQVM